MAVGQPGRHRRTYNHCLARSARNKKSGKYARQRERTERNKLKKTDG